MSDQYYFYSGSNPPKEYGPFYSIEDAKEEAYDLLETNECWLDDHTRNGCQYYTIYQGSIRETPGGLPIEKIALRQTIERIVYPTSPDSTAWDNGSLDAMNWQSYCGRRIRSYRLIPEEVLEDEGLNPDAFMEAKLITDFHAPDLEQIQVYKEKKRQRKAPHKYIPVGITTDGRFRACTLIDVEGLNLPDCGHRL